MSFFGRVTNLSKGLIKTTFSADPEREDPLSPEEALRAARLKLKLKGRAGAEADAPEADEPPADEPPADEPRPPPTPKKRTL
jgi:hypothetical protein